MAVTNNVYYKRLNKWADALVSRKYKQGMDELRTSAGTFCCLGVACDISKRGKWVTDVTYAAPARSRNGAPPMSVRNYFGFKEKYGTDIVKTVKEGSKVYIPSDSLANLNDLHNFTFSKIAKIIRKYAEIKYGPKNLKKTKG